MILVHSFVAAQPSKALPFITHYELSERHSDILSYLDDETIHNPRYGSAQQTRQGKSKRGRKKEEPMSASIPALLFLRALIQPSRERRKQRAFPSGH